MKRSSASTVCTIAIVICLRRDQGGAEAADSVTENHDYTATGNVTERMNEQTIRTTLLGELIDAN